jgi:hypothetical protein
MASTYEPIATQTLGSSTSSVTFSSIPSGYTDLILVTQVKGTDATDRDLCLTINGDTASNYSRTILYGDGTIAGSVRASNETVSKYAIVPGTTTNQWEIATLHLMNYSNATTYKTGIVRRGQATNGLAANVILWRATPAAITTLVLNPLVGSFSAGSTFTLYGIKAA